MLNQLNLPSQRLEDSFLEALESLVILGRGSFVPPLEYDDLKEALDIVWNHITIMEDSLLWKE